MFCSAPGTTLLAILPTPATRAELGRIGRSRSPNQTRWFVPKGVNLLLQRNFLTILIVAFVANIEKLISIILKNGTTRGSGREIHGLARQAPEFHRLEGGLRTF
jgi:hypothetical protein